MFFFFNDTATTEIYTLSLHDALPICMRPDVSLRSPRAVFLCGMGMLHPGLGLSIRATLCFLECNNDVVKILLDRKSTRLNSSHQIISYAVFCLKKKKRFDEPSLVNA